ncbi:MAG: hypothetical protein JO250_12280, partial [Armatimonadetes bacterium]|nr:hypothetical protein [Armatimonadota bacterium]
MQEANSPPIPGPIILAKVGRVPAKDDPAKNTEASAKEKKPLLLRLIWLLLTFSAVTWHGLTVAALIHQQWAGLKWLALGLLCLLMIPAVIKPLANKDKRHEQFKKVSDAPQQRDERTVVLIDRLKEYTDTGALGGQVPATGATAWLTQEGLYLSNGRHLSWSCFVSFSLDRSSAKVHRVRFQWPPISASKVALTAAYIFTCSLAGLAITVFGAVGSFHRLGLRDDVLALFFAAGTFCLMALHFLINFAFWYVRRFGSLRSLAETYRASHRPRPGKTDWLALISREAVSEEEVVSLLSNHLPELKASGR